MFDRILSYCVFLLFIVCSLSQYTHAKPNASAVETLHQQLDEALNESIDRFNLEIAAAKSSNEIEKLENDKVHLQKFIADEKVRIQKKYEEFEELLRKGSDPQAVAEQLISSYAKDDIKSMADVNHSLEDNLASKAREVLYRNLENRLLLTSALESNALSSYQNKTGALEREIQRLHVTPTFEERMNSSEPNFSKRILRPALLITAIGILGTGVTAAIILHNPMIASSAGFTTFGIAQFTRLLSSEKNMLTIAESKIKQLKKELRRLSAPNDIAESLDKSYWRVFSEEYKLGPGFLQALKSVHSTYSCSEFLSLRALPSSEPRMFEIMPEAGPTETQSASQTQSVKVK